MGWRAFGAEGLELRVYCFGVWVFRSGARLCASWSCGFVGAQGCRGVRIVPHVSDPFTSPSTRSSQNPKR